MRTKYVLGIFIFVMASNFAWAQTPRDAYLRLHLWETEGNPATSENKNEHLPLEFYWLKSSDARAKDSIQPSPQVSAFIDKVKDDSGIKGVRLPWMVNPADSEYKFEVAAYATGQSVAANFWMVPSASRSRFILAKSEDPRDQVFMTIKSGVPQAPGNFIGETKEYYGESADLAVSVSDYLVLAQERDPLDYVRFVPEPKAIRCGWQGQSFRDYTGFFEEGRHLLPLFTPIHNYWGIVLALANGRSDPIEFWSQILGQAMGRAVFEQWFKRGLQSVDLHSQNAFLTADPYFQPMETVVMRDSQYSKFSPTDKKVVEKNFSPLSDENEVSEAGAQPKLSIGFVHGMGGDASPLWDDPYTLIESRLETEFLKGLENAAQEMSGISISANDYILTNHLLPGDPTISSANNYMNVTIINEEVIAKHQAYMTNLSQKKVKKNLSRSAALPEKPPFVGLSEAELIKKFPSQPDKVARAALISYLRNEVKGDLGARLFELEKARKHSPFALWVFAVMGCVHHDLVKEIFRRGDPKGIYLILRALNQASSLPTTIFEVLEKNKESIENYSAFWELRDEIVLKHQRKNRADCPQEFPETTLSR